MYSCKVAPYARNSWLGFSITATLALLWMTLFPLTQVFAATTQTHRQNMPALSYNCISNPDTGSGHCYGAKEWGGANGADTRITVDSSLKGGGGIDSQYFINTEMWLNTSDYAYWVEAGIKSNYTDQGSYNPFLFWADNRPNGRGYAEHWGNQLNGTDYNYGNVLARITRSGSSNWNVLLQGGSTRLTGTSTYNNISIGNIEIGTELYGQTSSYSPYEPVISWIDNRWVDNNGHFLYQGNDGIDNFSESPVYANWSVDPRNDSTGGVWYSCLTGNGC